METKIPVAKTDFLTLEILQHLNSNGLKLVVKTDINDLMTHAVTEIYLEKK